MALLRSLTQGVRLVLKRDVVACLVAWSPDAF